MTFEGDIADIMPHDPPMVLLDRYVTSDKASLIAEVHITASSPFFEAGLGVPSYIGIEYIAQAISAFNGLTAFSEKRELKPGFLLGSRNVSLKVPYFPVGKTVCVSINVSFNDGEMAVFDGEISLDGDVIVQARINAFQPADPMAYIQTVQEQHI